MKLAFSFAFRYKIHLGRGSRRTTLVWVTFERRRWRLRHRVCRPSKSFDRFFYSFFRVSKVLNVSSIGISILLPLFSFFLFFAFAPRPHLPFFSRNMCRTRVSHTFIFVSELESDLIDYRVILLFYCDCFDGHRRNLEREGARRIYYVRINPFFLKNPLWRTNSLSITISSFYFESATQISVFSARQQPQKRRKRNSATRYRPLIRRGCNIFGTRERSMRD